MELGRNPFQGVTNIVRFNWHLYLIASIALLGAVLLRSVIPSSLNILFWGGIGIALATILSSLMASYYIYDRSDLYHLPWLKNLKGSSPAVILNVSAGFDETSSRLANVFPEAEIIRCDFYNPEKHTEISIERARKLSPSHVDTVRVVTNDLPFKNGEFDLINVFMAAHEVRDSDERVTFFKELHRISSKEAVVIVTEHLRDANNFLAFTFGFLHFYSRASWIRVFCRADFKIIKEVKTTPFITTFILRNNGTAN